MPELRRSSRIQHKPSPERAQPVAEPPQKKAKTSEPKASEADHELQVGSKIPDLTLLDQDSNDVNLSEVASKTKYLVIFAYPKASTPGCTRQACGFRDSHDYLKGKDTAVYGLSSDTPNAQKNFITKQNLPYSLLSDPETKLIGPLGAKKSPSGIKRSHWIFVDGILKVKKVGISPEESFGSVKKDIDNYNSETKEEKEEETGIDDETADALAEGDAEADKVNAEKDDDKKYGDEAAAFDAKEEGSGDKEDDKNYVKDTDDKIEEDAEKGNVDEDAEKEAANEEIEDEAADEIEANGDVKDEE